jgi:hypothetical protein
MVQKNTLYGLLIFTLLIMSQNTVLADLDDMTLLENKNRILDVSAGYYWASTDDNPDRAAEYKFLEDSPTFGLVFKQEEEDLRFSMIGTFINDNDYSLEGSVDYKTLLRVQARTDRMYHNLDHIPYQDDSEARPPATATEVEYQDHAPGVDYGRKITIDEVKARAKLPTYPAHINLSYWRMEKKGKEQLRFVDESCAGSCHMQSNTRKLDRVTEEITAGFDAHLGPVDIAFLQTLREFREKRNSPEDDFNEHNPFFGLGRPAGEYVHDEAPDSKLLESTFMVNLPTSGGFVSSASYTIGKRENQSNLTGGSRKDPETDYQKLATDVSYTPGENWTVSFRYRMLDLDSDSPATLTENALAFNNISNPIPVRESIDIKRNNYATFISYRPSHKLTFKGEFEYEDTDRNNTGVGSYSSLGGITNPNWAVPDNEETSRLRLTLFSRLLEKSALKFNGWYEYTNVDNPAYGTSLSDSNELFFSASYKPSAIWGTTGSIDILRGKNDDRTVIQFEGASQVPYDIDRDEESENLALGLWFIPNGVVSADFNYGWLHSKIDQDVLFGSAPDPGDPGGLSDYTILDDNADFEQKVHTLSAGINLRIMETVDCRLEGYHIRSHSEYTPDFNPRLLDFGGPQDWATPDNLDNISEVDIRQNGMKARIRWAITEVLTAGFEYTFDDYEDQNSDVFDGSSQTFIASLTGAF